MSCAYCGTIIMNRQKFCSKYCQTQYAKKRKTANAGLIKDGKAAMASGLSYGKLQAQRFREQARLEIREEDLVGLKKQAAQPVDRQKEQVDKILKAAEESGERLAYLRRNIPPESAYQKKIIDYLNSLPETLAFKNASGGYQRAGLPDILCVSHGRFCAFEVKRPMLGRVSRLQLDAISKIRAAGGVAAIVSLVSEVRDIMSREGLT